MNNLRYLSIDPTASLWVLTIGGCAVALLYGLQAWALARARRRTRQIVEACDREQKLPT